MPESVHNYNPSSIELSTFWYSGARLNVVKKERYILISIKSQLSLTRNKSYNTCFLVKTRETCAEYAISFQAFVCVII